MQRMKKQREIRDTILIVTNGKRTETNYFNSIRANFKSIYKIKLEFHNYQCDKLVEYGIEKQQSEGYNQVWCVFDIDDTFEEKHLLLALKESKKFGINIALSNESFEIWLMFHLTNFISPSLTRDRYEKELTRLLREINPRESYSKADRGLIDRVFIPRLTNALTNAKKVCEKMEAKHQLDYNGNTNYPVYNWRSFTTIFRLIEALKLED